MSSSIPPVQLLGNAAQMLLETAAADPARRAVIDGDATTRYSELAARSLSIARTLQAVGVEPDDRVAVFLHGVPRRPPPSSACSPVAPSP
jgi:non-ribosomal peptide synthetase component F